MITLTATLTLADLNDLADVCDDHATTLTQAVAEARKAVAEARKASDEAQRLGYRDAFEKAWEVLEDASDALARWNALRAELWLR